MISEIIALAGFVLVLFVTFKTLRTQSRIEKMIPSLDDLVRQDLETGEWQVNEKVGMLLQVAGSKMFQSAKMSMLQGLSADRKLEKGLEEALTKDVLENKFPLIDAGAEIAGDLLGYNVKSYITKHPRAIFQLLAQPGVQSFLMNVTNNGQKGPGARNQQLGRM